MTLLLSGRENQTQLASLQSRTLHQVLLGLTSGLPSRSLPRTRPLPTGSLARRPHPLPAPGLRQSRRPVQTRTHPLTCDCARHQHRQGFLAVPLINRFIWKENVTLANEELPAAEPELVGPAPAESGAQHQYPKGRESVTQAPLRPGRGPVLPPPARPGAQSYLPRRGRRAGSPRTPGPPSSPPPPRRSCYWGSLCAAG